MLVELTVRRLLLVSWEVPAGRIARSLPAGLEPALLASGRSLVSVALLRNDAVRVGRFTAPGFSQANVRTYVDGPAGPGLFFLSIRVGLAALGAALWGIPVRPARIRVEEGVAEAPGLGFSFHYRRLGQAATPPAVAGVPVGDQQAAYFVSAGLRKIAAEHESFRWEEAELVAAPRFDPILALGFDLKAPDSVLAAAETGFRLRLPPARVS